jgi:pSer/pThr/pTyr-binding forkhead associated (FHA) protein
MTAAMDQSKKTMRHFYCRDVLWETFEQMANDFDCSIDYLINEAMRYYARSKNYHAAQQTGGSGSDMRAGSAGGGGAVPGSNPPAPQPPAGRRPPPPPPGATGRAPSVTAAMPAVSPPGQVRRSQQMPVAAPPDEMSEPSPDQTLFLVFNSQKYSIDKDQFIIGRGSKTSDLAIKDGNISRKHAAVIRRNGAYYIKDLGSTNGIDYKGMRIDNKRIDEGDVFHLCDYELRFTFRG